MREGREREHLQKYAHLWNLDRRWTQMCTLQQDCIMDGSTKIPSLNVTCQHYFLTKKCPCVEKILHAWKKNIIHVWKKENYPRVKKENYPYVRKRKISMRRKRKTAMRGKRKRIHAWKKTLSGRRHGTSQKRVYRNQHEKYNEQWKNILIQSLTYCLYETVYLK